MTRAELHIYIAKRLEPYQPFYGCPPLKIREVWTDFANIPYPKHSSRPGDKATCVFCGGTAVYRITHWDPDVEVRPSGYFRETLHLCEGDDACEFRAAVRT